MAPHYRWLILLLLAVWSGFAAQMAYAQTATPPDTATPTDTATPAPTGTPAYQTSYTLDSGNELIVERRWTFGELAIFLAVVAHGALTGLRWIYDLTRHEQRDVQDVRIVD